MPRLFPVLLLLAAGPASSSAANVVVSGELRQWHKVTLTLDGPFAREGDDAPNPFLDYRLTVRFQHASGTPSYDVPGYFAADGNAGETSAEEGTRWRAHLAPDAPGRWTWRLSFVNGRRAAVDPKAPAAPVPALDGATGTFDVLPTDKTGRDFRARGRLQYVGGHYLRFAGSGEYFLKAGADAPETLLAYADFDGSASSDGSTTASSRRASGTSSPSTGTSARRTPRPRTSSGRWPQPSASSILTSTCASSTRTPAIRTASTPRSSGSARC